MSVNAAHVIAHVNLSLVGTFDQITDFSYNTGIAELIHGFDGEVDNSYIAPGMVAPTISFSTTDIATAMAGSGWDGLKLASGSDVLTCYLQKVTQGGLRAAASSNHITMVMNEGILIPQSLTVSSDQLATISYLAVATKNTSALPVVFTNSQTYTAENASVSGWTLGPIKPSGNSAGYEGNTTMTIDFGIQLETMAGDGEGYPTFTYIARRQPTVTFTSKDATLIDTLSETGKSIASASTKIYLRKVSTTGNTLVRVADVTAEHISFQLSKMYASPQAVGGSHGGSVDTSVMFTPINDGSNATVIIATGVAIAANV